MNYKLFLTVLLILTVITTLCICAIRPKMHKSVMVYNSDFKIVPQNEVEIEIQNIPTVAQNQSSAPQAVQVIHFEDMNNDVVTDYQTTTSQNVNVNTQTSTPQRVTSNTTTYTTTQTIPQNVKQTSPAQTKVYTTTPAKTTTTTTAKVNTPTTTTTTKVNTPQAVTTNTPQIDLQKILDNNKKYQNSQNQQQTTTVVQTPPKTTTTTTTPTKVVSAPVGTKTTTVPTTTTKVQTPTPATTKVLTPQEEEIAWQIWRSNLQNKIMQDAKLPNVPQGTIFKFTFDVDKYGKVSNIHTSCTNNAQYTPYAIQYIAPVIRAYQGRSILNFPEGSKRVTTSFVGSFKVSNSSKYSTAGDYKDTERISR